MASLGAAWSMCGAVRRGEAGSGRLGKLRQVGSRHGEVRFGRRGKSRSG